MENTPMKLRYSASSSIRRDKCHFPFPTLFHKWAQTLFMILAVMDAGINHAHPCVFFATFQTAERPGLLKYNSRGTGDKCECESSTSSNQVPLKNWTAAGFHSHLLDKESTSAWWSESQTEMREDFFICWIFLSTEMEQTASLSLPSQQGGELSPVLGDPEQMPGILGITAQGPHLTHFWTISDWNPHFCQIFSAFALRSKPKNSPGEEKEEAEEDEKENYAYCSEIEGLFFSASEEMWTCGWGVLRNARCKFRFLCYYSWRALPSWWSKRIEY